MAKNDTNKEGCFLAPPKQGLSAVVPSGYLRVKDGSSPYDGLVAGGPDTATLEAQKKR